MSDELGWAELARVERRKELLLASDDGKVGR